MVIGQPRRALAALRSGRKDALTATTLVALVMSVLLNSLVGEDVDEESPARSASRTSSMLWAVSAALFLQMGC